MTWLRRTFWFGAIAYWLVLFGATHMPPDDVHIPSDMTDKQVHFIAYMLLALLLGIALVVSRPRWRWIPLFLIGVAMVFGAIDELTQPLVNRSCDLRDWIADVSGASVAAVIVFVIQRLVNAARERKSTASRADASAEASSLS